GERDKMKAAWPARPAQEREPAKASRPTSADWLAARWAGLKVAGDPDDPRRGNTGVAVERLKEIGTKITAVPKDFHVHRTIQRFLDNRRQAIETGQGIDWATSEALATCSLLLEGFPVRLSGQ